MSFIRAQSLKRIPTNSAIFRGVNKSINRVDYLSLVTMQFIACLRLYFCVSEMMIARFHM